MSSLALFLKEKKYFHAERTNGWINMKCPYRDLHPDGSGIKSAYINAERNQFKCFSCGKGSSAINILLNKFEMPFDEAIDLVQLDKLRETITPYEDIGKEEIEESFEPENIYRCNNPPQSFLKRGFSKELLLYFQVGVNPVIDTSGKLLSAITIPLFRKNGTLAGIKYRRKRIFWYTKGFEKEKFLYHEPTEGNKIILTEGESDVFQAFTNGTHYVSALLGSELSEWVVKNILRNYKTIYSAMDNDIPGMEAAEKIHWRTEGMDVLYMPYGADDPGCCPKEEWQEGISGAEDYYCYSAAMQEIYGDEYLKLQKKIKYQLKI